MSADVINPSFATLKDKLARAKTNLKGLNDNIRRIIGREITDQNFSRSNDRKRPHTDFKKGEPVSNVPERSRNRDGSPSSKRVAGETKSVFSRLSGPPVREEEDFRKPKIHSRVIKELPSRQEIVAAQGSDERSRARNRRMFGSLMGTLQKFCQEESRLKSKEDKKAKIERKLEEKQMLEREKVKQERQNLFSDRKRQQLEIRMIELKMIRIKEQEIWEQSNRPLVNFIKTKTKPHIFFRPKIFNEAMQTKLNESQKEMKKLVSSKKQEFADELLTIEGRFKQPASAKMYASIVQHDGDRVDPKSRDHNQDDRANDQDSSYSNSDTEDMPDVAKKNLTFDDDPVFKIKMEKENIVLSPDAKKVQNPDAT